MGTTVARTWADRNFNVYAPTGIGANRPLLIALHPGLSSALSLQVAASNFYHVMDYVADALDMYVVYPNGEGRLVGFNTWNAGDSADTFAGLIKSKDMLFLRKMIQIMELEYSIDTSEVYMFGYSNGAMMVYRYLMERPGDINKVITCAGSVLKDFDEAVASITNEIIHVHGAMDVTVPMAGGEGNLGSFHRYKSTDDVENFFEGKGATFTRLTLPNGEHDFPSIKSNLLTAYNIDIFNLIEEMIVTTTVLEDFEELNGVTGLPQNGPGGLVWSTFGGTGQVISATTTYRTKGTQGIGLYDISPTKGIQATGVNLTGYSKIMIDVWADSDGDCRLKVIDNAANEVSMDTTPATLDPNERHLLFVDITGLADLSSCSIQISGWGRPFFDNLRGM